MCHHTLNSNDVAKDDIIIDIQDLFYRFTLDLYGT